MQLVWNHTDVVLDWIERTFDHEIIARPVEAVGVVDQSGTLRGALVAVLKTHTTAELHVYGRISNDTWRAFLAWLFEANGLERLEARTTRDNDTIKRNAIKAGFKWQGVERDYFGPGEDALAYYMTPANCRWIEGHGRQETAEI